MLYCFGMIAQISGRVIDQSFDRVVVFVAGIGYEVLVPQPLLSQLPVGQDVTLLTHHHIRENSQELYGFTEGAAKELFEQLLSVSGVGPKGALAVMGLGDQSKIRQAIGAGDVAWLAAASGVGKRTAERITVELKDKVGIIGGQAVGAIMVDDDARSALMALGYSVSQASHALSGIDAKLPTEERVRQALKRLS